MVTLINKMIPGFNTINPKLISHLLYCFEENNVLKGDKITIARTKGEYLYLLFEGEYNMEKPIKI